MSNMVCCRTAASRLAERKEDIAAAVTPDPNPQAPNPQGPTLTKSPSAARRVSGEPAHHSKAAAFLLKNPKASVSMMRRSPSKKGEAGAVATAVSQIEAAASPFELAQVTLHSKVQIMSPCYTVYNSEDNECW